MDFTQKKFRNMQTDEFDISPKKEDKVTWRPSAYGIVTNEEGKILLIVDGRSQKWEFPGGGIDLGETPQEGVMREVNVILSENKGSFSTNDKELTILEDSMKERLLGTPKITKLEQPSTYIAGKIFVDERRNIPIPAGTEINAKPFV